MLDERTNGHVEPATWARSASEPVACAGGDWRATRQRSDRVGDPNGACAWWGLGRDGCRSIRDRGRGTPRGC